MRLGIGSLPFLNFLLPHGIAAGPLFLWNLSQLLWRLSMYPPRIQCCCENPRCHRMFTRTPSAVAGGEGRFCSYACRWAMSPRIERTCANPDCRKVFFVQPNKPASGRGVYCSAPCRAKCCHPASPLEKRFWSKVAICEHGQDCIFCCWNWQAACQESGHGVFHKKIDGLWRTVSAHVQAWELLNAQPLPEDLMGLHYCWNAPCVNPMHIYPGTKSDNAKDALRAGTLPHHSYLRGEAVNTAKLTAADVSLMRELRDQGWLLRQLSSRFDVSIAVASKVVTKQLARRSWKHIP